MFSNISAKYRHVQNIVDGESYFKELKKKCKRKRKNENRRKKKKSKKSPTSAPLCLNKFIII